MCAVILTHLHLVLCCEWVWHLFLRKIHVIGTVCLLTNKWHLVVQILWCHNTTIVALFTQVTNSCTMVVVHELWGWHVELVRLLLALHILCLNHLHISRWIECW